MAASIVHDPSEATELCASRCLYLKPIAKLTISVTLPECKETAWAFSNKEVIDQLKNAVSPDQFINIKVGKSTKEFIRLEGEVESKGLAQALLAKLHGSVIKMTGFNEDLSVEVTEANTDFPTQQEWESALNATEETDESQIEQNQDLPDSMYFEGLPRKWFLSTESSGEKPSEDVLRMVFERFGTVKNVDIPMLDPYREEVSRGIGNNCTLGSLLTFAAFVQYEDYEGFVKAMQSLRGMKLMFKGDDGKNVSCNMKVTFDTTRHFSEEAINKRNLERLKLQELEQERKREKEEAQAERKRKYEERKSRGRKRKTKMKRKMQKQTELEEKPLEPKCQTEAVDDLWLDGTEEWEERKLLLAQRRVESIKLLTTLLDKVQEYMLLNSTEPLLDHELNEDNYQATKGNDVENREAISAIVLDDDLDWDEKSECHLASIGSVSEYTEEEEEEEEEEEDTLSLSISSSVSSCDSMRNKSKTEIKRQSRDRLLNEADMHDYNGDSLQITMSKKYKQKETRADRADCHIFGGCGSRGVDESVCYKKPKIYETDEFIHYLLNYYQCPAYARVCPTHTSSESTSWWQRVVFNNGNGFQIHLTNPYGQHCTEVEIAPGLEQEALGQEGNSEWDTAIWKPERGLKSKALPRLSEDVHMQWSHTKCNLPSTKQKKTLLKNTSSNPFKRRELRQRKTPACYKRAGLAYELKDVLEEISSDSEYFSEELKDFDKRVKGICKDDCRLGCNNTAIRNQACIAKRRRVNTFLNSIKGETYHRDNVFTGGFGLHFTEEYEDLKPPCRYKRTETCKSPSSTLRSEEQNSEYESSDEEKVAPKNTNNKKAHDHSSEDGDHCCSENGYNNQFSYLQNTAWRRTYQHTVDDRSRAHEHKGKLKTSPNLLSAEAHPLQRYHRRSRQSVAHHAGKPDVSACTAKCKHCKNEQPAYNYCHDICTCHGHPAANHDLKETESFSFCPKRFQDYLDWERYIYGSEGFASKKVKAGK